MADNQSKKKPVLWASELVQLVVPSYDGIGWGRRAHVARSNLPERTVCGARIKYWWFRCSDHWTVGALCDKWRAECGVSYPNLRIQGTHLGARLDITPEMCSNCYALVMDGKRPQWASEKDICPYCYDFYESCQCLNSLTLEESLALHGFSATDAGEG